MRVSKLSGPFAFLAPIDAAASIALDASGKRKPVWIPAAIEGDWFNAKYGNVEITADDLTRMYSNFRNGLHPVQPQQLPIDYEHLSVKKDRQPGDGKAAGWILDLELRQNAEKSRLELWAQVDWNDEAAEKISKKEYRGFSPLYAPNWVAHGNKELGATLLGGALTNYQTIPDCVVTCSLDPLSGATVPLPKIAALAVAEDLSLSERERRVRTAVQTRYPTPYKDGYPDIDAMVWVRDVFEDHVVFEKGGKLWRQDFTFGSDLSVSFDGEPREVIYTDVELSHSHEGTVMKLKNSKGEEIEIPAASFAGLSLDQLSEIPGVKALRDKVPGEGSKVVSAVELDTLNSTVTALSSTVETLKTDNAALKAAKEATDKLLLTQKIDGLIAKGKILPKEKETFVELATANPTLFEKLIAARADSNPIVSVGQEHGSGGDGGPNNAIVQFDNLVAARREKHPTESYAESVRIVGTENKELAVARNRMLTGQVQVGPGGMAYTQVQ